MTLEQRLNALANTIGPDVKALRLADGNLSLLSTTTKSNLVAAINEVYTLAFNATGVINDAAVAGVTNKTYSVDKILSSITDSISSLRNELRAGAGAALDTFAEVAAQLALDESGAAALVTAVNNRVRFDSAMTLTSEQQAQARSNIDAASTASVTEVADSVTALSAAIGNTDVDYVAAYVAART